jgi:hypothetical protein
MLDQAEQATIAGSELMKRKEWWRRYTGKPEEGARVAGLGFDGTDAQVVIKRGKKLGWPSRR